MTAETAATLEPVAVPRLAPTFRLQWEEAQGCYVILYPEGMVQLSRSAGEILRRCDGKSSVGEIIQELRSAYENADLAQDVLQFLQKAKDNGWIRTEQGEQK